MIRESNYPLRIRVYVHLCSGLCRSSRTFQLRSAGVGDGSERVGPFDHPHNLNHRDLFELDQERPQPLTVHAASVTGQAVYCGFGSTSADFRRKSRGGSRASAAATASRLQTRQNAVDAGAIGVIWSASNNGRRRSSFDRSATRS